jgi:tripartite-type tricarboxylate transporter receptor subunit TctC
MVMDASKRAALVLTLTFLAYFAAPAAHADNYPSRPIRVVVGFSPGSTSDITARVLGQKLQAILGQPIVIENRPGGGNNIAAEFVARAAKDGYTLYLCNVANTIRAATDPDPGLDFAKDLAPITLVADVPILLVASPALGVKNVSQLVALAKTEPGQIFFGSSGVGSAAHLAGQLFNSLTGVSLVHVPYPGSAQALTDVLAGRIQLVFSAMSTVLPQINAGKLVAIGVAERERVSFAPNIPTLTEQGLPDFEATNWSGLLAPAGTPPEIIDKLAQATAQALKDQDVVSSLSAQGISVRGGGPDVFRDYIGGEIKKWAKVGADAGMTK